MDLIVNLSEDDEICSDFNEELSFDLPLVSAVLYVSILDLIIRS